MPKTPETARQQASSCRKTARRLWGDSKKPHVPAFSGEIVSLYTNCLFLDYSNLDRSSRPQDNTKDPDLKTEGRALWRPRRRPQPKPPPAPSTTSRRCGRSTTSALPST